MRHLVTYALATAAAVLLAACGSGAAQVGVGTESPDTAASSASASHVARAHHCSPRRGIEVPTEQRTPGWDGGVQLELARDRRTVTRYGREHPAQFAGVGYDDDPITVWVAFTGDVDRHCTALRELVDHPERLEVVQRGSTVVQRRRIRRELDAMARPGGQVVGLGNGRDHVSVDVTADGEALAAELVECYGDALEVTVGALPYPPSKLPASSVCPQIDASPWPDGVRATIAPETDTVTPGTTIGSAVTIVNDSDQRFTMDTGEPVIGLVYRPGETAPVGGYVGAIAGHGREIQLAPGQRATLGALIDAASCVPSDGYTVPPATTRSAHTCRSVPTVPACPTPHHSA